MNIHERIKSRRKECQMSVEDVASELGVSRSTIYRYESSEISNIGIDKVEPLARVLHTTPEYLMGWTDDPVDYSDGDIIAGIPSCYVDAVDQDAMGESIGGIFQECSDDLIQKVRVLAEALNDLNTEGQERVIEYAEDLVACGRYKKFDSNKLGKKEA